MANKAYTKKQIIEAIEFWKKRLDEQQFDRQRAPTKVARQVSSSKPTKYYIAVDYSSDFSNYGQFITPDGTLTDDASNVSFTKASTTTKVEKLKQMINDAIRKYGDEMHIFVFKDDYAYGPLTHKNHARPSLVDVWYPMGKYWKYGLKVLDSVTEAQVSNL